MSLDGAVRLLLAGLDVLGLEPAAVAAAAGLPPRALDDPAVPLGAEHLHRVLAGAEAMSGDPLLGLHLAERLPGRGALAYLARTQRTAGEGLLAFARFAAARWGAAEVVTVTRRPPRAVVRLQLDPALSRHAIEFLLARTAIALRRSGAPPREAWLAHAPGGAVAEYERVLGCAVRFRRAETRLLLRDADLDRPLRTANPDAAAALAAGLRGQPAPVVTLAERLAAAVDAAWARGVAADREGLARALGMSGKTLARRLAAERLSFRALVESRRRELAERLLADPTLSLGEIAARLGFTDLAAFGKAFRRWHGMAPSAYRARRRAR